MAQRLKSHLLAAVTLSVALVFVALVSIVQRSFSPTVNVSLTGQGSTLRYHRATLHGAPGPENFWDKLRTQRDERSHHFSGR